MRLDSHLRGESLRPITQDSDSELRKIVAANLLQLGTDDHVEIDANFEIVNKEFENNLLSKVFRTVSEKPREENPFRFTASDIAGAVSR